MNFRTFFEARHKLSKRDILQRRIDEGRFPVDSVLTGRGYLLADGDILCFGGEDHRYISRLYFADPDGDGDGDGLGDVDVSVPMNTAQSASTYMIDFMYVMNAVRFHQSGSELVISYVKNPTPAQINVLLRARWSELSVDKLSKTYHVIKSGVFFKEDEYELERFLRK